MPILKTIIKMYVPFLLFLSYRHYFQHISQHSFGCYTNYSTFLSTSEITFPCKSTFKSAQKSALMSTFGSSDSTSQFQKESESTVFTRFYWTLPRLLEKGSEEIRFSGTFFVYSLFCSTFLGPKNRHFFGMALFKALFQELFFVGSSFLSNFLGT